MSFLSNLWNTAKNVVNTGVGVVKSGLSGLGQEFSNTWNAIKGAAVAGVGSLKGDPYASQKGQVIASGGKVSADYNGAKITPTSVTSSNSTNVPSASNPYSTYQYSTEAGPVRPSTYTGKKGEYNPDWKPTTDSYGRTSNADIGNPYENAYGELVVPKVAFSGLSGSGSSFNVAPTPTLGAQGMSGMSSYTGTLTATGGASPSLTGYSTEEDKKKTAAGIKDIQNTSFIPKNFSFLPQITPNVPFTAGPINTPIDAGAVVDARANKTVTGLTNVTDDRGTVNQQIANGVSDNLTKTNIEYPIPENPVIDTPAQLAFMEQSADPFGVRQAMDEYKALNTDLGKLTTQRLDVMKQIQALNDTYSPIIDQIKNNPNMPKGLAARRLEEINKSQKNVLQGFLNQMELVNQSIDDQNKMVDRAFNIVSESQNAAERAQDNARQNLSLMINSGAIGGFTDKDIQSYSQATGIPTSSLAAMRTAANQPDLQTSIVGTESTGYFAVSIDKKTGKTVSKTQIVGAPQPATLTIPQAVASSADAQWVQSALTNLSNNIYSTSQREELQSNVNAALAKGDVSGAKNQITTFAYNQLKGDVKNQYDLYETSGPGLEYAATQLSEMSAGPWKALLETSKPWALIQKDQKYTSVRQQIEMSQAQMRKGFYGTAVTSTEAGNANKFLISDSDDILTIQTKLKGAAAFMRFVNDATISVKIGAPKPKLEDYLKTSDSQNTPKEPISSFNFKF